jgi:hypothetical protein
MNPSEYPSSDAGRAVKAEGGYPTARAAIKTLEGAGLLEEYSGRAWGKVWIARPVIELLERPL